MFDKKVQKISGWRVWCKVSVQTVHDVGGATCLFVPVRQVDILDHDLCRPGCAIFVVESFFVVDCKRFSIMKESEGEFTHWSSFFRFVSSSLVFLKALIVNSRFSIEGVDVVFFGMKTSTDGHSISDSASFIEKWRKCFPYGRCSLPTSWLPS